MAPYTNNKQYHMKIELGIFNLNAHALGSYTRTKHPKEKIFFCKEYKRTTLYHLVQHSMSTEKTVLSLHGYIYRLHWKCWVFF